MGAKTEERAQQALAECCVALDHLRDAAEKLEHGSPARRQIQAATTLVVNAIDNMPLRQFRRTQDAEAH